MFKKIYNTDKVEEKNMLKKICVIGMTLCMLFGVTACGSNSNSSSVVKVIQQLKKNVLLQSQKG